MRHVLEEGSVKAALFFMKEEMGGAWYSCDRHHQRVEIGDCVQSAPMDPVRAKFLSTALEQRGVSHSLSENGVITMDVGAALQLPRTLRDPATHAGVHVRRQTLGEMADTFLQTNGEVKEALGRIPQR